MSDQTTAYLGGKVGVSIADKIARSIVAEGWPVGMYLGTEGDLMEQYSVSRGGLREAICILEQQGVVQMRRGRGGGLWVTAPGDAGIVQSAVRYLTFRRVLPEHLQEARHTIELSLIPLIVDRMNNENARRLRAHLEMEKAEIDSDAPVPKSPEDIRGFHTLLGSLTGNPALELCARVVESLVRVEYLKRAPQPDLRDVRRGVYKRHKRVVDALVERDLPRALAEYEETLAWTKAFYVEVDRKAESSPEEEDSKQ
ncbi:FadR/GntR family transcriptional regulator [Rhodococcus sp. NCIMB 12038]|uniref:FadR/GntR family transcriptional regulator n=1 Tax=Rhodococcus sp. NCIMB 12038 TaxID=933800 RepID=UPI00211B654B|nr:GntR family transcriptional regulator [Rhodococcus sp. NCIMB 12038]